MVREPTETRPRPQPNCRTNCVEKGSLVVGTGTMSGFKVCPGESVTFSAHNVTDTGGTNEIVCTLPDGSTTTNLMAIPPGGVLYKWELFRGGVFVKRGTGSPKTEVLDKPGNYICTWKAVPLRKECAPSSVDLPSQTASAVLLPILAQKSPPDGGTVSSGDYLCQNQSQSIDFSVPPSSDINTAELRWSVKPASAGTFPDGNTGPNVRWLQADGYVSNMPDDVVIEVHHGSGKCGEFKLTVFSISGFPRVLWLEERLTLPIDVRPAQANVDTIVGGNETGTYSRWN